MRTQGPNHRITLEPATRRWRASFMDHVIADTDDALILREAGLSPVVYFPRQDVATEYMGRTAHHTRCPYKGEASYFTLTMDGQVAENVAWTYQDPFDAVSAIANRIAFYTDRVEVYDVDDAAVNPHHHEPPVQEMSEREEIDAIIQHTDAGSGASQREHWTPNVELPRAEEGRLR
jgi:uncharacterized protein (DUF427 family)